MNAPAHNFLVVHDRATRETSVEDLGTDAMRAMAVLREKERELDGSDIEVVVLGADSVETLKRTHSSYFGGADAFVARLRGL